MGNSAVRERRVEHVGEGGTSDHRRGRKGGGGKVGTGECNGRQQCGQAVEGRGVWWKVAHVARGGVLVGQW